MDARHPTSPFDEYLWPLTGAPWEWSLASMAKPVQQDERHRRLEEIYQHVQEYHVRPSIRRLGKNPSPALVAQVIASIIEGATDSPLWERRLHEPVPRALREEWRGLCEILQREAETASREKTKDPVSR